MVRRGGNGSFDTRPRRMRSSGYSYPAMPAGAGAAIHLLLVGCRPACYRDLVDRRAAAGLDRFLTAVVGLSRVVFIGEYVVRLWSAPESTRFAGLSRRMARLRWALSVNGLICLLAVFPVFAITFARCMPTTRTHLSSASSGS